MKFDIYGRFQLEVLREKDHWSVYRLAPGMRTPVHDFVVPPELTESQLASFLDDVFHESAVPGARIRHLDQP